MNLSRRVSAAAALALGTPVFTKSQTAAADFTISNGNAVSVGHKPTSTDPRDVYGGVLDNLNIIKG